MGQSLASTGLHGEGKMSEIQDTGQGSTQCPACGAAGVPVGRFCSRCGAEMAASSGAGTLPPSVPVGAVSGTTHADTPPSGVGRVNQSLGDPAQQTAETLIIHPVPKRPQRIGLILAIFCLMIRRPPRSTPLYSSAASDVYKRQAMLRAAGAVVDDVDPQRWCVQ